jgi:hypothetical protein
MNHEKVQQKDAPGREQTAEMQYGGNELAGWRNRRKARLTEAH